MHVSLGRSILATFSSQLLVGPLSVSLKTRFPYLLCLSFFHIYGPFDLHPYSCFSRAHSLMPLLFWQRNDWRDQPRQESYNPSERVLTLTHPLTSLTFRYPARVLSSNVAHFLPDAHTDTRTRTYITVELASPSLPPSSLTSLILLPHLLLLLRSTLVKEYLFSFSSFRVSTLLAYISISISIIARELPASSGASQGCGLQMVFRRYFRFPLPSSP